MLNLKHGKLNLSLKILVFLMISALIRPIGKTEEFTEITEFSSLKEIGVNGNILTLKTDKPASFNTFTLESPPRLVIELANTVNSWKKKEVALKNNALFSRVSAAQYKNQPEKITRVVVNLKDKADFKTESQGEKIIVTAQKMDGGINPETKKESSYTIAPTPVDVAKSPPPAESNTEKNLPQTGYSKKQEIRETLVSPDNPTSLFGRQPVTLDFYDIDIRDLFTTLSEKAGVNVVYGDEVKGTVSIQLRDVPFKDAVDTILALKNLRMVILGKNILQLMTPKEFDTYKQNAISMTKLFPINYAKASDVNSQLMSILATLGGKGKTIVDDRTNSIIVTDTPEGIETTARLITDLDKPTPQVMIEAKIVQVQLGKTVDLGITWGVAYTDQSGNQMVTIGAAKTQTTDPLPGSGAAGLQTRTPLNPSGGSGLELGGAGFSPATGLGLSFGFVKDVVRLNAALSALETKRKSKVLSNPKIATLNNQAAVITSQTNTPYITSETSFSQGQSVVSQKVNTSVSGVSLSVTPTINADGRITMKIVPNVTSSRPTSIGVPETTSQQTNTTVIVRDGETIVIGGLISELESDERSQVPILGSIPLLGHFFKKTGKSKSRAELLVFVTPKIMPY